jgi:hypothetical protein
MPTQPNSPRPRGLAPLLRGVGVGAGAGNPDQHLRVSDAERRAVADRLAEHFSEGRLDQAEFNERVGQAMNAKTRGDLRGLFDDLPEPGMPGVTLPGAGAPADMSPRHGRRRGYGNRMAAFALIVVITAAAAETVVHMTVPWLWIGFLALAMLVATERANRSRADRPNDSTD